MAVPDDELCPRCRVLLELADDGGLRRHACCRCHDYGWFRVKAYPGQPEFGRLQMCRCEDAAAPAPRPTFDPIRQGVPYRLSGARLELAGNGSGAYEARQLLVSWPPANPLVTFLGEPGRGKSWLGASVLRSAFELHGVYGWFVDYPSLMGRLRATQADDAQEKAEDLIDWLLRMPLLVLDDVGKGNQTKFTSECLYRVLGGRESAMKPTLTTANVPEFTALEPSLKSRLMGGLVVQFEGPDRRPQQAQKAAGAA